MMSFTGYQRLDSDVLVCYIYMVLTSGFYKPTRQRSAPKEISRSCPSWGPRSPPWCASITILLPTYATPITNVAQPQDRTIHRPRIHLRSPYVTPLSPFSLLSPFSILPSPSFSLLSPSPFSLLLPSLPFTLPLLSLFLLLPHTHSSNPPQARLSTPHVSKPSPSSTPSTVSAHIRLDNCTRLGLSR